MTVMETIKLQEQSPKASVPHRRSDEGIMTNDPWESGHVFLSQTIRQEPIFGRVGRSGRGLQVVEMWSESRECGVGVVEGWRWEM